MPKLNSQQKRLLFDYCFDLTTKTDTAQARDLIGSNGEAENLCTQIQSALEPLKNLQTETCPDYVAVSTMSACCCDLTVG